MDGHVANSMDTLQIKPGTCRLNYLSAGWWKYFKICPSLKSKTNKKKYLSTNVVSSITHPMTRKRHLTINMALVAII